MELFYKEYGDRHKPLIVFLHGGGVSSWMWDKQVEHFLSYHVVVIDLPGHGKSKHIRHFSIEGSARNILILIEQLANGKRTIIIGFSLGAQVLVKMLSMKPHLIDDAVVTSALVNMSKLQHKMIKPMIKLSSPLMKNKWFQKHQAKALYIGDEMFEKYYLETKTMSIDTLVSILKENMSFTLPKDFSKANANILIIVGEKERSIMKKSAKQLVLKNSNCVGIMIKNIGHGFPLAKPNLFNEVVEQFLLNNPFANDVQRFN